MTLIERLERLDKILVLYLEGIIDSEEFRALKAEVAKAEKAKRNE